MNNIISGIQPVGNFSFPIRNIYYPTKHLMSDGHKNMDPENKTRVEVNAILQKDSMRIILADDDIDDRDMFSEALGELGSNVSLTLVEDGNQLLHRLHNDMALPHVIFLDLNMPNKNGKECLELIRKDERLKNIPVVIYSTSASTKDIDETFELGANLYMRKSSSFNEILSSTRQVLALSWDKYKPKASRKDFVFNTKTM